MQEFALLAAILEHADACCAALRTVGLDVAPLLAPSFRETLLQLFTSHLASAADQWRHAIAAGPLAATGAATDSATAESAERLAARGEAVSARALPLAPPLALLRHPPLAHLCNHLLAALNELRLCAPTVMRAALLDELGCTLRRCVHALAEMAQGAHGRPDGLSALCSCFRAQLLPHILQVPHGSCTLV